MERSEAVRLAVVLAVMGGIAAGAYVFVQNPTADEDATQDVNVSKLSTANDSSVCIVFFYSPGCPHCANVEEFLDSVPDDVNLTVQKYPAREEPALFNRHLEDYDVPESDRGLVPAVFVGDEYAIGDRPAIELIFDAIMSGETIRCPSVE
jgi:glutaredoxin